MNRDNPLASSQTYSVSATAERIGVAPATLRTWARRHAMGPSEHASGSHRRYTDVDLAKLMTLRTYLLRGATASEAVAAAVQAEQEGLALDLAEARLRQAIAERDSQDFPERHVEVARNKDLKPTTDPAKGSPERVSSNNSVLRIAPPPLQAEEFDPADYKTRCMQLVSAALGEDEELCSELISIASSESAIDWWKLLVIPALDRIAGHTVLAEPGKSPRLLIGGLAYRALSDSLAQSRSSLSGTRRSHPSHLKNITLVFSSTLDDVDLSAHVLAAELSANKCNSHVVLGPQTIDRISELVNLVRPIGIAFASRSGALSLDYVRALCAAHPDLPIYIGVAENREIHEANDIPHVSTFNSFHAMFHEIRVAAQTSSPGSEYWPVDPVLEVD